ncbi:MAG: hypothetical protein KJ558_01310 [Gammaproteobacteria bacterium]|nr:hypothetical protein [Gammaproteobacteria bacterium]MBU1653474.1 hypothetical protein [Gammaproteobacteria bacterium]MBU1962715.1 hypothetical protein [Gammaproteobacteria bacterium]
MREQILGALGSSLSSFWPLGIMIALAFVMKSAWFKGKTGEFLVNFSAKRRLKSYPYLRSFRNI